MNNGTLVLADDIGDRTPRGRLRSRRLRDIAIEFSKLLSLKVELIFVINSPPALGKTQKTATIEKDFEPLRLAALDHFKQNGVQAQIQIRAGNPAKEIIKFLEILPNPQFLVIGTHGRKGLSRLFLGSIAEEVIRHSKIPTLALGPQAQNKFTAGGLSSKSQILLLSDLSKSTLAAEKFALKLTRISGCKLSVLNCLGDHILKTRLSLYGSGYVPLDLNKMFEDMKKEATRKLKMRLPIWKKHARSVSATLDTHEELIEKTFERELKKDYDLVVMGTHGRGPLLDAFIGSTTRKVILRSPLPVIIIRNYPLTLHKK